MSAVVAVVTDSTACLSAELLAGSGIRVVPLRVVLAGRVTDEGMPGQDAAVTVADVEQALRRGERVGTASPAPERFAAAYAAAASGGAAAVVSVHLSARLSGTEGVGVLFSTRIVSRTARHGPGTGLVRTDTAPTRRSLRRIRSPSRSSPPGMTNSLTQPSPSRAVTSTVTSSALASIR